MVEIVQCVISNNVNLLRYIEVYKRYYLMNDMFSAENRANRLKEERKRLKLIQRDAAEIIGMREASWIRYEKYGEPLNQEQIYILQNAGFDMSYVLFGESHLNKSQQTVISELYDQIDAEHQSSLMDVAHAYVLAYPKK